jgi:hypothetical protein
MDESEAGVASSCRTEGGIAVASSEMMELGMLAKMFSKSLPLLLLLSLLLSLEEVSSEDDEKSELEEEEDELLSWESELEPKSLVVSMSSKMSLLSR